MQCGVPQSCPGTERSSLPRGVLSAGRKNGGLRYAWALTVHRLVTNCCRLPVTRRPQGSNRCRQTRTVLNEKKKLFRYTVLPKKPAGTPCVQPRSVAVSDWRLPAVGSWQLAVGGGWQRLVVGDWWLVAVGSGWRLAVGRRWRLVAVGGWRLVGVGGWRLVVTWGGP